MVPYPHDEVEALERAARAAEKDGDYQHAAALRKRAQVVRRVRREREAGVRRWPTFSAWC